MAEPSWRTNGAEIEAIATSSETATISFALEALERSGRLLQRVSQVFFNLIMATALLALLPSVLLVLLLQKYVVAGLSGGAVKG